MFLVYLFLNKADPSNEGCFVVNVPPTKLVGTLNYFYMKLLTKDISKRANCNTQKEIKDIIRM